MQNTSELQNSIEITPEMIEAGAKICAEVYGVCSEYVGEGLAVDVFKAMIGAIPAPSNAKKDQTRASSGARDSA